MKDKFYLKKYLIAFYDKEETCTGVYDNAKEFKTAYGLGRTEANGYLSKLNKGKLKTFQGQTMHLIDMTEDECSYE